MGRPFVPPKMLSSCFVALCLYLRLGVPLHAPSLRQQRTSFLCDRKSRISRLHVHDVIERRLQCFWEGKPFHVAERVVHHVLTTATPTSRLLLPLCYCDNGDDNGFFSRCNSGNFSFIKIGLEEPTVRAPNTRRKKRSFRFVLAYAGQYFCGWQRQPNNDKLPSVQEVVEGAIASAFKNNGRPDVRVAGRTDAGVSALGQVARVRVLFDMECSGSCGPLFQLYMAMSISFRSI
jgi:hypothetical protein